MSLRSSARESSTGVGSPDIWVNLQSSRPIVVLFLNPLAPQMIRSDVMGGSLSGSARALPIAALIDWIDSDSLDSLLHSHCLAH